METRDNDCFLFSFPLFFPLSPLFSFPTLQILLATEIIDKMIIEMDSLL
jgi:hypothetical protein